LVLLSFSFAQDDDVLVLTADNFDETISQHKLILVEFYAPWCGHCKKLAPEYAQAATELKGIVPLAKVDADAELNRPLAQRFAIRGFPTLKVFRNGEPFDYQGERSAQALISSMKRQAAPAITKLDTAEDATAFSTQEKIAIIGFFDNTASAEYNQFKETAEKLRQNFIFGAVVGHKDVNKEFEATTPSVVLFKDFDERKNVLDASSFSQLEEFIAVNSIPIIDEVGPHNFRAYAESGLPLLYLFVELKTKDTYIDIIRSHAVASRGKLNFVFIDWEKYAKHSERLGLSGKVVPAIAIENLQDGTHYAFDESAQITSSSVGSWIQSFVDGTLLPTIKSEEIPENNNGPVKVVVAKTFDQIVNDATKDVLVEFYAPWCGHCKQLAPIYEQLGEAFSSISSIVIAKIDATSNDVNPKFEIRGFPTIKLFPANNKENPINYQGDRTKDDLLQFVQENASIKFQPLRDEL